MKIQTFKRYLREADDKTAFNSFVEDVFAGKWNTAINNFGNFTDKYHCTDALQLYRIVFFQKTEIAQLTQTSDLQTKLAGELTSENQGNPRFFTKDDYHNIKDHLSFLSSIGQKIHGYTDEGAEQTFMGIIVSQKAGINDNVDFGFYKNGNTEIMKRIDLTKPVLAVNSENFQIVASLEFENDGSGWTINEFRGMDDLDAHIGEQPPTEEPAPEAQPQQQAQPNINQQQGQ